jgi:hypothetical protein
VSTNDTIISSDAVLSELEQAGLERILRAMIPASEEHGVPGADDPLIVADIIATGRTVLPELAPLLKSLGETALAISGAEPDTEALSLRQEQPEVAGLLVALAVQCYYRDDRVMASLDMPVRPPFPEGYEIADGDWSLLDPVRDRGPIYRAIPAGTDPQ